MGERFVWCEIIHGDDLEQIAEASVLYGLVDLPANSSESVDAYANSHGAPLLSRSISQV
jgi:hypothetical protein